jgi:hypothetical protein
LAEIEKLELQLLRYSEGSEGLGFIIGWQVDKLVLW